MRILVTGASGFSGSFVARDSEGLWFYSDFSTWRSQTGFDAHSTRS